jgi:hypothetical protein
VLRQHLLRLRRHLVLLQQSLSRLRQQVFLLQQLVPLLRWSLSRLQWQVSSQQKHAVGRPDARTSRRYEMTQEGSIPELAADLERQIEHCRRLQAQHAEQKQHHLAQAELHGEEGERLTADLQILEERYRALQAAVKQAGELAGRYAPPAEASAPTRPEPAFTEEQVEACRMPAGNLRVSRLLELLLEAWPEGEPFRATGMTREIEARFGAKLPSRVDPRVVGQHLRRLAARGQIEVVRPGEPNHEALYRRR